MNWCIILIDRCTHREWATILPNQTSWYSWKRWGLFRVSYRNYLSNKSIHGWCIEYIRPITVCSNIMEAHLLQIQTPRFLMRSQRRRTLPLLYGSSRKWAVISRHQLLTAWVFFTAWLNFFWDQRMVRSIPKTQITSNTVQDTRWEHN